MQSWQVELRDLDGRWYWFCKDHNGNRLCSSGIGFRSCGTALDNFCNQVADHRAHMRCRLR